MKQSVRTEHFDKQRARIMVRACQLFQRREFSSLTIEDLCDSLKMNKASFYRYFESKEALLFEIHADTAQSAMESLARIVGSEGSAADRLRRVLKEYVQIINAPSHSHITIPQIDMFSGKNRKDVLRQRDAYQAKLVELVEEGIKEGSLHAPHPRLSVILLLSTLNHVFFWFKKTGRLSLDEVAEYSANHIMSGLLVRPCVQDHHPNGPIVSGDTQPGDPAAASRALP